MIEVTETWDVVDRWWTDKPERKQFAALRSDAVDYDIRVCVCYDEKAQRWTLIDEPLTRRLDREALAASNADTSPTPQSPQDIPGGGQPGCG